MFRRHSPRPLSCDVRIKKNKKDDATQFTMGEEDSEKIHLYIYTTSSQKTEEKRQERHAEQDRLREREREREK